jgi:two-component system, LytTR family, response regulator
MRPISTLIVDDEILARTRIRNLLRDKPEFVIVGECANGREAVTEIEAKTPDLIFLDVQMPDLDGFGVLGSIDRDNLPVIVFVTAYDQYALKAFEVHALDYLLKPFDDERFEKTLEWVQAQFQRDRFQHLS